MSAPVPEPAPNYAHELLDAARAGDRAAQETLLAENSRLIWGVARRYFGRGAEAEDLFQLGAIGFLKAVAGYDEDYGTRFSTYAVPKIAGEIRRFLRDDGPLKVSRTLRERAWAVGKTREALRLSLGREPRLSELSAETGLAEEELIDCELATAPVESLQRETEEGFSPLDTLADDGFEEPAVERVALEAALRTLPEADRQLISLRYFHGLTQQAAARVLGTNQVQVSRREKRVLLALREKISE